MKINYKLALESLEKLEEGAMRQAMIRDDREGGHWEAEEVQDHYSNVKLALEQAEKLNMGLRIALNSVYGATSTKIDNSELIKKKKLIELGYNVVGTNTFRKFIDYNGKSYRIVIDRNDKANILVGDSICTQQDIYDIQIVFSQVQDELKKAGILE